MRILYLVALLVAAASVASAQAVTYPDRLFGDWKGESRCVSGDPRCHDEVVVYHLTKSKSDPEKVNLSADKIVNGKPDYMGEFDLTFDPAKMTLIAEVAFPRTGGKGVWTFKIDGDKMDGTLTIIPENKIFRKIHVERKKAEEK